MTHFESVGRSKTFQPFPNRTKYVYYIQEYVNYFDIELAEKQNPHRDYWIIGESTNDGHIPLKGTTGIAISNALYM